MIIKYLFKHYLIELKLLCVKLLVKYNLAFFRRKLWQNKLVSIG